jgi:glycosyltransferase involved in cell wall biosynthesis
MIVASVTAGQPGQPPLKVESVDVPARAAVVSRPLRVLHFYKSYFPDTFGGAETVINEIARSTANLGIETEVLSLSRSPAANSVYVDGHWAKKARLDFEYASTGFSLSVLGEFARRARSVDLVHYHFPWPLMDVAHFFARVRTPTVVTYHSDVVRQQRLLALYEPLMHRFLKSVTHIVGTSPNYRNSSPVLQRYSDKVSIIPIGARRPPTDGISDATKAAWHARLGERFFLFVGALRYYKGLSFLLDAAATTGYPVAIVGKGELSADLAEQVRRRSLGNVHMLGEVRETEKAALLESAYAFVFPSHLRSEAFGVALLEAAAFGRPLISCEIGTGTSYVNADGETGLVIAPADAGALAAAMTRLWEDRQLVERLGSSAQRRYERLFTVDLMGASYASLYRRLVEQAAGTGANKLGTAAS